MSDTIWLLARILWGGIIIALYILGTMAILFDRFMWVGAGAFGVFILLTILLVHQFWEMTGQEAAAAWNEVKEHISMIGAMIVVCIAGQARQRLRQ